MSNRELNRRIVLLFAVVIGVCWLLITLNGR